MAEPNNDQGTIFRWKDHIVPLLEHPDIHIRDKALVAVAWESYARPDELHRLRFGDIDDRDNFVILNIAGSKGHNQKHSLRGSIPYLKKWLQNHPVTEVLAADAEPLEDADPSTPVWTQIQRNEHLPLKQFIKERARERAGVTTEVTLHDIRRSVTKLVEQDEDSVGLDEIIKPPDPIRCPDCSAWTPPHQLCIWCGTDY